MAVEPFSWQGAFVHGALAGRQCWVPIASIAEGHWSEPPGPAYTLAIGRGLG
jgi:hypothetical protein